MTDPAYPKTQSVASNPLPDSDVFQSSPSDYRIGASFVPDLDEVRKDNSSAYSSVSTIVDSQKNNTSEANDLSPVLTVITDPEILSLLNEVNAMSRVLSPIEKDPRVELVNKAIEKFEEEQQFIEARIMGASYNSAHSWGKSKVEDEAIKSKLQTISEIMQDSKEKSESLFKQAKRKEEEGRLHESRKDMQQAQKCYNQAHSLFEDSLKALQVDLTVKNSYKESNSSLETTIARLATTEKCLRHLRDGCVMLGATIATGGEGTIFGTFLGTGIGACSSLSEAGSALLLGQMNIDEVPRFVYDNTKRDFINAGTASLSTRVGVFAAGKIGGPCKLCFIPQKGKVVVSSVTAGGASAATSTAIEVSQVYIDALIDFHKEYGDLPAAKQRELYSQFMEARNLSVKEISLNFGYNIILGCISGGVGGHSYLNKIGADTLKTLTVESSEAAISIAIGLSATYVRNGEVNPEDFLIEAQSAILGMAQGHIAAKKYVTEKYKDGTVIRYNGQETKLSKVKIGGLDVFATSNKSVLRRMYEAARALQVGEETARRESKNIMGFIDPYKDQILLYDAGKQEIRESFLVYATALKEGRTQVEAYQELAKDLQGKGYTIDFSENGACIRGLKAEETPTAIDVEKIKKFVNTKEVRLVTDESPRRPEGNSQLGDANKKLEELKKTSIDDQFTFESPLKPSDERVLGWGDAAEVFVIRNMKKKKFHHYAHSQKMIYREDPEGNMKFGEKRFSSLQEASEKINNNIKNLNIKENSRGKLNIDGWKPIYTTDGNWNITIQTKSKGYILRGTKNNDNQYVFTLYKEDKSGGKLTVVSDPDANQLIFYKVEYESPDELSQKINKSIKTDLANNSRGEFIVDDCKLKYSIDDDGQITIRNNRGFFIGTKNPDTNQYNFEFYREREFDLVIFKNSEKKEIYAICEIKESIPALLNGNIALEQQLKQIKIAAIDKKAKEYRLCIADGSLPSDAAVDEIPNFGSKMSRENLKLLEKKFQSLNGSLPSEIDIYVDCGNDSWIWDRNCGKFKQVTKEQ